MEEYFKTTGEQIAEFLVEFLIALLIIFVSFRIIKLIARRAEKKLLNNPKLDKTLVKTLVYLARITVKTLIVITLIGFLGVDTSGFAALITSLGVGIGLAVNGALSNFAGGALLLITRPFAVDDYIEVEGYSGTVEDIHIINTRLRTPDNKVVYIPNGILSASTIINYSVKNKRRVDLVFRVGGRDDGFLAKGIIEKTVSSHPLVMKGEDITVKIKSQGKAYLPIIARVWVKTQDYWTVYFDLIEQVKIALDESGFKSVGEHLTIETE